MERSRTRPFIWKPGARSDNWYTKGSLQNSLKRNFDWFDCFSIHPNHLFQKIFAKGVSNFGSLISLTLFAAASTLGILLIVDFSQENNPAHLFTTRGEISSDDTLFKNFGLVLNSNVTTLFDASTFVISFENIFFLRDENTGDMEVRSVKDLGTSVCPLGNVQTICPRDDTYLSGSYVRGSFKFLQFRLELSSTLDQGQQADALQSLSSGMHLLMYDHKTPKHVAGAPESNIIDIRLAYSSLAVPDFDVFLKKHRIESENKKSTLFSSSPISSSLLTFSRIDTYYSESLLRNDDAQLVFNFRLDPTEEIIKVREITNMELLAACGGIIAVLVSALLIVHLLCRAIFALFWSQEGGNLELNVSAKEDIFRLHASYLRSVKNKKDKFEEASEFLGLRVEDLLKLVDLTENTEAEEIRSFKRKLNELLRLRGSTYSYSDISHFGDLHKYQSEDLHLLGLLDHEGDYETSTLSEQVSFLQNQLDLLTNSINERIVAHRTKNS